MFLSRIEERIMRGDMERVLASSDAVPVHFFYRIASQGFSDPLFGNDSAITWSDFHHASCFGIQQIPKSVRQADGSFFIAEDYDAIFYIKETPEPNLIDNETVDIVCNNFHWKPVPLDKIKVTQYNSVLFLKGGQIWTVIPVRMGRKQ